MPRSLTQHHSEDPKPKYNRVSAYFGSQTFDLKAMGKKLSLQDQETMGQVMKIGGKIAPALAERIAAAVQEWALERGVTHYCHWFQPQNGLSAEKHDAFLSFDKHGLPIERFTGFELLQSEPDASSFPSGGMRSTFEARGYTGWDPSSPMFILERENGKTLYIPSVFISYHGEALDFKTPLLRSCHTLSLEIAKTLHFLGEKSVSQVFVTVGPEQEFFVVDKTLAMSRLDLKLTGRTVFGKKPPKGQELEDHYFGHIPDRIQAFINDLERELYSLGVPLKTRHNEVAPGQFEVAPIFESANIAADHNQLLMKCLGSVGLKHDFLVLLHEKPFAYVNGSGKHVNWSLCDSKGRNLLDPGPTPHNNLIFLSTLCGILQGVCDHADVLRASIASAGNDHRLGANEAPPAIISVFLGQTLDKILNGIEHGHTESPHAEKMMIDLGAAHLQNVSQDNTDRNRTSPFAFTGNKFEFRAVGSSGSIGYPTAVLNAAVCDGLKKINQKLSLQAEKDGTVNPKIFLEILKDVIAQTKQIRFEGNGYSEEWRQEAARRGLSNFSDTPSALRTLRKPEKVQFLIDSGVFNQRDIDSRAFVQMERYVHQRLIEAQCALDMTKTQILPAALHYQKELLEITKSAKDMDIPTAAGTLAHQIGNLIISAQNAVESLEIQVKQSSEGEACSHERIADTATFVGEKLMSKKEELRHIVDSLEGLVPKNLWPISSYTDLLFSAK